MLPKARNIICRELLLRVCCVREHPAWWRNSFTYRATSWRAKSLNKATVSSGISMKLPPLLHGGNNREDQFGSFVFPPFSISWNGESKTEGGDQACGMMLMAASLADELA